MVSKVSTEFRKYIRNCYELRRVLLKTQQSLDEISSANLFPGENLRETFLNRISVATLQKLLESLPALLVFGQSCHAKSVFINSFIGEPILPLHSSNWRWVRLLYSRTKRIRLTLGSEFEIVEPLEAQEHAWTSIPEADLRQSAFEENHDSTVALSTMLEVELPYPMLRDNIQIYVPPACPCDLLPQTLDKGLDRVLPVIFYVIETDLLNEENISELRKLKEIYPDLSIMFIKIDDTFNQSEVTNGSIKNISEENLDNLRKQLENLDFINVSESLCRETFDTKKSCFNHVSTSFLTSCYDIEESTSKFVRTCLQLQLIQASAFLSEVHNNCLRTFILSAFDMAREIQITPRRLQYAQQREAELYKTLMDIASMKQEEISRLIQLTLQDMKAHISDIIEECTKQDEKANPKSIKMATAEIQQLVLRKLSNSVATELVKSVDCFQESFTGTLQRCLLSLEKNCDEREDSLLASDAVKQILNAAYNVDLKSPTSFSLVHTFLERLRKLLHGFQLPWASSTQMHLNIEWRKQVANDMIDSLTAYRLARTICIQFQERVRASHDSFVLAMKSLENHYSGKLVQTEEQRVAIRKHYAPHLARLALDSTSMCDLVRWGIPQQGKEIGRGQYGVVFACQPWAGVDPCAVKSVVPPDERHWNDLAMEFYYTRTIPEHPRIVRLRGSIVDHSYGAGCSPAVLLIMERMVRDLYYGLRAGLPWKTRLQISIDVVEGIRYLHSQGLVHRDIKLKNVLLDCDNRAKLTDLGFCIPEAMMSGSIVGTPVHMAPELLSGHYDSSVDVYAFGILFWYVCAGHVRLPYVFEQFQNKEQLWNNVRKGIRPERLSDFDDSCWNLMQQCWSGEPSLRPLLGDVQPQLETIMNSITDGD